MKKFLISTLLLAGWTGHAASLPDSVAMTVGDKKVSVAEFLFSAEKNGETNLADKKNLESFVQLFGNFKLKVVDAEAQGLDQTQAFKDELDRYKAELLSSYLSDKEAEDAVVAQEYTRMGELLDLSHILFFLPEQTVSKDTVAVYQQALEVYNRIQNGEDLESIGQELMKADPKHVGYEHVRCFGPMKTVKAFEDQVYGMADGTLSIPFRTKLGFHIVKLHRRIPNPGRREVAHILIPFKQDSVVRSDEETRKLAESLYQQIQQGADFGKLAEQYSADKASAQKQGLLPVFGLGEMVQDFERVAFALQDPGEVSAPFRTQFGYHIVKLVKKLDVPTLDDVQKRWHRQMAQGEWNFALYKGFDDRLKQEYHYTFYPEAYAELQALCDDYFPTDKEFWEKAEPLDKTLARIDTVDFKQNEFAAYIVRCPFSVKTYSGDFMQEVYDLFVRDILTNMERKNLPKKHPEYELLLNEYRDGILLFNISNDKIWNKPMAEQKALEEAWIQELRAKYPVEVNWKALEKAVRK